jgi:hypothetical protein
MTPLISHLRARTRSAIAVWITGKINRALTTEVDAPGRMAPPTAKRDFTCKTAPESILAVCRFRGSHEQNRSGITGVLERMHIGSIVAASDGGLQMDVGRYAVHLSMSLWT